MNLIALSQSVSAELVIIVNADNPVEQLSREEVIDIYMGRNTHFPGGNAAQPIDQATDAPIREEYYQKLHHKNTAQVKAFWARLRFSGRATPPQALSNAQMINTEVVNNKAAIAYVDSKDASNKTKIVLRLP
jgi:ABC-type phosphate transport system substrate-binding protein